MRKRRRSTIRTRRIMKNMTAKELSDIVGISERTLIYYETNDEAFVRASFRTVFEIMMILNISLGEMRQIMSTTSIESEISQIERRMIEWQQLS